MFDVKIPQVVSSTILGFASNLSKKNMLRIVDAIERFTKIEWHDKGIAAVRKMIEEDHPGIQAARRALQKANPKVRAALLNNFLLGAILLGYNKRYEFWEKHDVAPPGNLMISVTLRCNLRCYGCYAGTHENKNELSREEVENLIIEAGKAGTNLVTLLGGEPFTVPWLLDVVEKYPNTAFQIFTNGLLINDEKVERLAKLGNAIIAIGIDGMKEETDGRKGEGAFEGALSTMRKLSEAGVLVGYSTMVSQRNFDSIYSDEFLDTIIEHGAAFGWCATTIPQGKACKESQLVPTPEQKAQIVERVRDARSRKPIIVIDFYSDAKVTEGCGAARTSIHVNANGDVEPCVLFPFAVDNIREKPFVEILKSDFFKGLRQVHKRYPGELQTCMMVFKPQDVIDVVHECGARETSEGTLEQLTILAKEQQAG